MAPDQPVEQAGNVFLGEGQSHGAQPDSAVQSAQKEIQKVPDTDTVAAIATALHLSGRIEAEATFDSDIAAAIAAALHLHLIRTKAVCGSNEKSYALSPWSQYGRKQIQNARFQVFNRRVSS